MSALLSIVAGGLFTAGFYLMLRRSIVNLIIGLILLGHASNLLLFAGQHLKRARPAFAHAPGIDIGNVSDPVPQALILTAIVIGFSVQAFAIILIKQSYRATGSDDLNSMRTTDTTED